MNSAAFSGLLFLAVASGYVFPPNYASHMSYPNVIYGAPPQSVHIDSNNLNTWTDLGGNGNGRPIAIVLEDGNMDVYIRDHVYNKFRVRRSTSSNTWRDWFIIDGDRTLDGDAASAHIDHRTVVVIGGENDVMAAEYTSTWRGYRSLNFKSARVPTVAGSDDGSFYIFAVGFDGVPYMSIRKDKEEVSQFSPMNGIEVTGGLAAVGFATTHGNHVMVFAVKIGEWYTGYLHYAEIINGRWDGKWVNTDQFTNDVPAFSTVENGFVMVVGDGMGRTLVRSYDQTVGWSAWVNLDGRTIYRAAVASTGINTAVFIISADQTMYVKQTFDGLTWSAWRNISGPFTVQPSAVNSRNVAHVFTYSEKNTLVQYALPLLPVA